MNLYRANGVALGGVFTRIEGMTAPAHLESQASCSLPNVGGHGQSLVENFRYANFLSFQRAYTTVSGDFYGGPKRYWSLASSVVEGLNLLDILTADRVVSRISCLSPEIARDEPEYSFNILGSKFDNLRIAGYPVEVEFAHAELFQYDTYSKLEKARPGKDWAGLPYGIRKEGDTYWCSMVRHLRIPDIARQIGLENLGGGFIRVRDFGVVRFAEMTIRRSSRQFTMLQLDLGSPVVGRLVLGSVEAGGQKYTVLHASLLHETSDVGTTPASQKSAEDTTEEHRPRDGELATTESKVIGGTVYESSGAIPEVRPSVPFAEEKVQDEPGKRYADFTFYRRSDQGRPSVRVGRQEPLAKTEMYDLEVAVRTQPTGIPMRDPKEAREGISEPRKGEAVDVLVIASSADFDIPEPVQRLRLTPSGDSSENAVFKELRPRRTTPSKDDLAKIRVRLLYNLNLLENAIIDAEVVSSLDDSPTSILGLDKTIGLHQDLSFREYRNFELIQPRQMHILIRGIQGGFELAFTLLREGRPDVVLTGATRVFETSLEGTLAAIRRKLLGISMWEEFENGIVCKDSPKFEAGLRVLAQDGRELWTKLFELDVDSALFQIGDWLKNHPLPENSLIQVSIDRSASRFVLPWNLLYERDLGEGAPDPKGFWGLRYHIEQETDQEKKQGDAPTVPERPLEIGFLVSRFHEASLQEKFLNGIATASKGRIAKVVPIDTAKDALDFLQNHAKQFVLFFAHGHTQFPEAARVGTSEDDFLKQYEKLPKKSQLRKAWTDLYESIKKKKYDSDKSWIKLQHGKLFLLDLYGKIAKKFGQEPMVLLNMCESAQLTPSLQESFIHFFLNRGARVVIGTECSMRPLFAHHFAKELLEGILSGRAVGDVMLDARLNFMQKNNPLGLAYTLFGSPLTRFQPPPL